MSDTTTVTSDVKLCLKCGATFGEDDDKRRKPCTACHEGTSVSSFTQTGTSTVEVEDDVVPLKLDIDPHAPIPVLEKEYYWCGVTDDSPCAEITLGGVNFQKTKGSVIDDGQGRQSFMDHTTRGMIHHLTENQKNIVLEHAGNKSVRNYQSLARGEYDWSVTTVYR